MTPVEEGGTFGADVEASWTALLDAGINDWGGLSPLTRDFVNPEKPWPHIHALAAVTATAGFALLPRSDPFVAHSTKSPKYNPYPGGHLSVRFFVYYSLCQTCEMRLDRIITFDGSRDDTPFLDT